MSEQKNLAQFGTRELQPCDGLVRHYQKIGAPAIAAALDVVVDSARKKGADGSEAEKPDLTPSFLFSDDQAA